MPVSTTYEIEKLGITFDESVLARVDYDVDYDDYFHEGYVSSVRSVPRSHIYTFLFKDGSTLTHRNGTIRITKKVELIEGKMYQMGKDGKKWLALCRYDDEFGELTLFPTTRRKYAPLVRESDRMEYTFYKEFDHNYKEYL